MDTLLKWLRRYISPVFLSLLLASFILWYIAKLNYTYTAEQVINVDVDGSRFKVTCVVEGAGTNLFGYKAYMSKNLRIPISELKYEMSKSEGHEGFIVIDPQSLRKAISMRLSDIKVEAIGAIPELPNPKLSKQK